MAYGGYRYIDYSYEPTEEDFVVLVWAKAKFDIETTAEALAAESSVGTWTSIHTMNKHVFENYRARVFKIDKVTENSGFIYIAYPIEHFDVKNINQLWASVFGNVFGLKELEELYYLDIRIPLKYQKQFEGPLFGLEGVRKYVGTDKSGRMHVGTIVKPKVGLAPKEWAEVAYKSWANGLDLVKDDENLVDQEFCKWKERFDYVFDAMDKAESETGEKKLYLTNITDVSIERMLDRLDYIRERGHKQVMLDVFILGWTSLDYMLKFTRKYKLIVHAHRAGFGAWHRGSFGINFHILDKFYRLFGVDQLHVGTGVGKMEGGTILIKRFHDISIAEKLDEDPLLGFLDQEFASHIKPLMPVASGGLDATKLEALSVIHGFDTTAQAGGGVHGHPDGTEAGARSMRITAEKLAEGWTFMEIVQKYPEVRKAYEKWGYTDPNKLRRIIDMTNNNRDLLEELVKKEGIIAIKEFMWQI